MRCLVKVRYACLSVIPLRTGIAGKCLPSPLRLLHFRGVLSVKFIVKYVHIKFVDNRGRDVSCMICSVQLDKGQNFTQLDIDEGRIRYEHNVGFDGDSQSSTSDDFVFCLSDGINSSPSEIFVIQVSRDDARRLLVRNRELVIRDGETKVVGTEYLSADDGSGSPGQLEFIITRVPQHGTLGLAGQTSTPISTFTQADVRSQKVS